MLDKNDLDRFMAQGGPAAVITVLMLIVLGWGLVQLMLER